MSGSSACKQCGRPIVWAVTTRGKNTPVDPEPTPRGDLVLEATGTERGRVTFSVRKAAPDDARRHRSHFVSCPKSSKAAAPGPRKPTPKGPDNNGKDSGSKDTSGSSSSSSE